MAFRTLVDERGKLVAQVKKVVGDAERLRACLIEAEADGHRLRAELSDSQRAAKEARETLARTEADHARKAAERAKQVERQAL